MNAVVLAHLALGARSASAEPPAPGLFAADPFEVNPTEVTLDNGLRVLLLPDLRTDTVALHLTFGVGSRDEASDEHGCAHLFEHLMFEGSAHVPRDQFDTWLSAGGGENNAFTDVDQTAYVMTFPSGALDLALFLESDRLGFLDAGLDPENLANQQQIVLQERAEGYAEPNGRDTDVLMRLLFPPDHPYHHPTIGTVAAIEGFDLDGVRTFWERHYRPNNAALVLVGRFDTDHALERVRHWFSDVPARGEAPARAAPPSGSGGAASSAGLVEDDVEEATVYLAWASAPAGHADEAALDVLSFVLSNGRGTRLDDALYYRGAASSVGAWAVPMDLAGMFVTYASSPDTPLPRLESRVRREIARLAARPPDEAEIERAKRAIRGVLLDSLESVDGRAYRLAECWRRTGRGDCLSADWARIGAVTAADVSRVAATWLSGEPVRLSNVPRGRPEAALPGSAPVELP